MDWLRRYAGLMAQVAPEHRRAVATQTLREAHNRYIFLSQARTILGCAVELISGEREATLIYQGVSSLLPDSAAPRLVIDIGGRSTEICIGRHHTLQAAISCTIGSVEPAPHKAELRVLPEVPGRACSAAGGRGRRGETPRLHPAHDARAIFSGGARLL